MHRDVYGILRVFEWRSASDVDVSFMVARLSWSYRSSSSLMAEEKPYEQDHEGSDC